MSAAVSPVDQLLERERIRLDASLARIAAAELTGSGALEPPLRYAFASGGKRLRGALCVLAYRTLGGVDVAAIYDVAAAVELAHTYSLVHDDLPCMDNDDLRRGRPTMHRVFGSGPATLAGVALIPLAFRTLLRGARGLDLGQARTRELALVLAAGIGAGGMVGGQWLDLEAEGQDLELAELARIHAAKTGALFAASLELGALAADATEARVAALAGFGAGLGLAFQVVDDLLDETGDAASLGKTAGKDRRQDKATYPALLGLAGARQRASDALAQASAGLRAADVPGAELEAVGEWVLARDH
jgi:geranylgeranyl pyrophosphate synthase